MLSYTRLKISRPGCTPINPFYWNILDISAKINASFLTTSYNFMNTTTTYNYLYIFNKILASSTGHAPRRLPTCRTLS